MQDELRRLWLKERKTVVMVTHDVDEAVYLSERVVVMSKRPGRIVEEFKIAVDRDGGREATVLSDAVYRSCATRSGSRCAARSVPPLPSQGEMARHVMSLS